MIGLDLSSEMLGQAACKEKFALVRADAETLPFEAGSFDRILCINSFHHFSDKRSFVTEIRRVLREGGGFTTIGLDPYTGAERWWIYDYFENTMELDRQRYLSGKATCDMLAAAGFQDCRTDAVQHFAGAVSARRSLERGDADRRATSQLAILTNAEYERGVQKIQEEIAAAERCGQELRLITDRHLYASSGWLR